MSSFIGKLENLKIVQKSVVVKKCPAISWNRDKFWSNQILKRYFDFSETSAEECFVCKLEILHYSKIFDIES